MSEISNEEIRDLEWSIIRGVARHDGHLWSTTALSPDGMVTLRRAQWGVVHEVDVPIHELTIEASESNKHAKTILKLIEFYRDYEEYAEKPDL